MARLVEVCADLGHGRPWTFVNSGNVVFEASGGSASLELGLEKALEDEFGFECTTFVRSAGQLRTALVVAPFTVTSGDTYFVTFLKVKPSDADARALEALSNDFETLVVDNREVHWRMHGKSTDSRLAKRDWERILGVNTSTSRNTTMLTKLLAKIDA